MGKNRRYEADESGYGWETSLVRLVGSEKTKVWFPLEE